MQKKKGNSISLILGVITAVIILSGQLAFYPVKYQEDPLPVTQTLTDDVQDDTEQEEESFEIFHDAVFSLSSVSLSPAFTFISDIVYEIEESIPVIDLGEIAPVRIFLELLFQQIISPNAP